MDKADKGLERTEKRDPIWTFIFIIKILIDSMSYRYLIMKALSGRYYYPYEYMGSDWVPYPISTMIKWYIVPIVFLITSIILMLLRKENKGQYRLFCALAMIEIMFLIASIILLAISKPGPV